jgi:hypothetical protein
MGVRGHTARNEGGPFHKVLSLRDVFSFLFNHKDHKEHKDNYYYNFPLCVLCVLCGNRIQFFI